MKKPLAVRWPRTPFLLLAALCVLGGLSSCRARVEKKDTLRLSVVRAPGSLIDREGLACGGPALHSLVQETLLDYGENDQEPAPRLARRWEADDDRMTCSFLLDEMAQWSDGTPLTAADVAFTFQAVLDPSNRSFDGARALLGAVDWYRAEDAHRFRIRMKHPHYANLMKAGSVAIFPRHVYGKAKGAFTGEANAPLVGSGPYVLVTNEGSGWILRKDGDYWAQSNNRVPHLKDFYVFDRLVIRSAKDDSHAADLFRKGELDLLEFSGKPFERLEKAKAWTWTNTNVVRLEREAPRLGCWDGVALNLRKGPLRDLHFRKAVQLLLHRERMAAKLYRNRFEPASGPLAGLAEYPSAAVPVAYDPDGARRLLAALGYTKTNKGVLERELLERDGKRTMERASVELLLESDGENRWATLFREDALKAGVEIRLKTLDWAACRKRLEEGKFEACHFVWEGGLLPQPGLLFCGPGARAAGPFNFGGLDDFEVNRLVREGEECANAEVRRAIYRDLEKRILEIQPVLFLLTPRRQVLAYYKQRLAPADPPFVKEFGYGVQIPFWNRWTPVP
ncbi:MAG: ABC transporter substrate-binding protein [Spirochaetes bacterium]|nr:ABC transporter substrate-binding protein [Spirochaetota bacterium]